MEGVWAPTFFGLVVCSTMGCWVAVGAAGLATGFVLGLGISGVIVGAMSCSNEVEVAVRNKAVWWAWNGATQVPGALQDHRPKSGKKELKIP